MGDIDYNALERQVKQGLAPGQQPQPAQPAGPDIDYNELARQSGAAYSSSGAGAPPPRPGVYSVPSESSKWGLDNLAGTALDFAQEAGASGLNTLGGITRLAHRYISPSIPAAPEIQIENSRAGGWGTSAEHAAEFMIPASKVTQAEKAAVQATRVLPQIWQPAARTAVRFSVQAAPAAAITAAQTGDLDAARNTGLISGTIGAAMPAVSNVSSKLYANILGRTTGVGPATIERALEQASPDLVNAMRGGVSEAEILSNARDALQGVKDARAAAYQAELSKLPQNLQIDLKPVRQEVADALRQHRVGYVYNPQTGHLDLDFSRSSMRLEPAAQAQVKGVADAVWDWGRRAGDTSPRGVDMLKRIIDGQYGETSNARAFVQGVKNQTRELLNNQVPGYQKMTQAYAEASDFLDNLGDLSLGSKNDGTAIRKLTTLLNQNNNYRRLLFDELAQYSPRGTDIGGQVAGNRLSVTYPRGVVGAIGGGGIIGGLLGGHLLTPAGVLAMMTSVPRLVGEGALWAPRIPPYVAPGAAAAGSFLRDPNRPPIQVQGYPNYAAGGKVTADADEENEVSDTPEMFRIVPPNKDDWNLSGLRKPGQTPIRIKGWTPPKWPTPPAPLTPQPITPPGPIPGMERLGGTAISPEYKVPLPEDLKRPDQRPGYDSLQPVTTVSSKTGQRYQTTFGNPGGVRGAIGDVAESVGASPFTGTERMVHGVERMAEPEWQEKAGGASDVIRGGLEATTPAMIGYGVTNPVQALSSMGTFAGLQYGTEAALRSAGVPPEYSALASDLISLLGGGIVHQKLSGLAKLPYMNEGSAIETQMRMAVDRAKDMNLSPMERAAARIQADSLLDGLRQNEAGAQPPAMLSKSYLDQIAQRQDPRQAEVQRLIGQAEEPGLTPEVTTRGPQPAEGDPYAGRRSVVLNPKAMDPATREQYSRFRELLKGADNLGFDTTSQAVNAVLMHPDWAERWDVTSEPELMQLGNKFAGWDEQQPAAPAQPALPARPAIPPSMIKGILESPGDVGEAALQRMRDRGTFSGTTAGSSGAMTMDDLRDMMIWGGSKLIAGAQKVFGGMTEEQPWKADMISDFGQAIEPRLDELWRGSVALAERANRDVKRRSMEDLDVRIPDNIRVVSPDPTRTITGEQFHSLPLDQPAEGFLPMRAMGQERADNLVQQIWRKAISDSEGPSGSSAATAVSETGARPPNADFWNNAFSLAQRARYWYELSGESFTGKHVDLPVELQPWFIDAVAGTSGGVKPKANLMRGIGITAEDLQGQPVMTDLRDPASARNALNRQQQNLQTLKYGSFSGTMQRTSGLTNKNPLTTNDVQVASMFGIKGTDIGKNPILYEVLSRFFLGLRDAQNEMIPKGAQPWETWQMQAPAWVYERMLKDPKADAYDDYSNVFPQIIQKLQKAGVPTPGGKLTLETLMDPRTPDLMSGTRQHFLKAREATMETGTKLTPEGAEAAQTLNDMLKEFDPETTPWVQKARDDYEHFQRMAMQRLAMRKDVGEQVVRHEEAGTPLPAEEKKLYKIVPDETNPGMQYVMAPKKKIPSLISQLMSEVLGRKIDVSRLDWDGYGTFEGEVSPNLRIPLTGSGSGGRWFSLNKTQREAFLSMLGQDFNQAAMAASHFKVIPHGEGVDTYSIFLTRYDDHVNTADIKRFSDRLGLPVNVKQHPNGTVININIGGGKARPSLETLRNLALETFEHDDGIQDVTAFANKYASDYVSKRQYQRRIDAHVQTRRTPEVPAGDAGGVEGTGSAAGDDSNLARIREEIRAIARQRDADSAAWSKATRERLTKELAARERRLASPRRRSIQ